MSKPLSNSSLWSVLGNRAEYSACLHAADRSVAVADLLKGSVLNRRLEDLRGRSILLATGDQLPAALALIELDGIASRIVLYPPDLAKEHMPYVANAAFVDAIVSDKSLFVPGFPRESNFLISRAVQAGAAVRGEECTTEWVLLTSGTTGLPKLVVHTLESLVGGFATPTLAAETNNKAMTWSTFYDIRRYGGLQIFLRAMLSGTSLVLSQAQEPAARFLERAGSHGVTHISGTPSHWRRALMSGAQHRIQPEYVRLSGEIADQAILNQLRAAYPSARIAHAFASTEAGLAFEVNDELMGFPEEVVTQTPGVEMKVENGTLRVRSLRTASHYLGEANLIFKGADGFVDTCDQLELIAGRYYFVGRRDGIINVGGQKVHPEEVEAIINCHPDVQMSLVRTKKNPITGALVVADVVLKEAAGPKKRTPGELQHDILLFCREQLPPYKVPAAINVVSALRVTDSGKLERRYA